jgi:hypothetical protein
MEERCLLGSADEATISVATVEGPFSFDGGGATFQLACEANRIDLAFLFDPMMFPSDFVPIREHGSAT